MRFAPTFLLISASACFPSFSPEVNVTVTIDNSEHNGNGSNNGEDPPAPELDAGHPDTGPPASDGGPEDAGDAGLNHG